MSDKTDVPRVTGNVKRRIEITLALNGFNIYQRRQMLFDVSIFKWILVDRLMRLTIYRTYIGT